MRLSQLGLSVKTFNRVTEQMKRRFRYATLEQGWRYYRKQAVLDMTAEEQAGGGAVPDQWIAAEVYETKRYRVRFNCTAVKRSECTCPEEGGCKHMAAVYFQLCDGLGKKPELYLAEFRQVYIEEERQRMVLRKRAEHKAELERRKKAWQMSLSPSAPAQEWHDFFQRKYSKPFTDYHSPVTDIADWAQNELYREGDRFPKEVVPLYRMHVLLFLLRQLSIRYGLGSSRSYPGRDAPAEETVRPYMEELRRLAESYDLSATPAAYEQHVAVLGEIAEAVALSEEESAVDGLDVLALLWSTVLNRPDWMEEAHRRLERMLVPVSSLRPRRRDAIRVALVHLEVLLGREAEAVKRLSELTYHNDPGRYWGYLSEHERSGRYDRIVYWLGALAPLIRQSGQSADLEQYWEFWKRVYERMPDKDGLESLVLSLLPGIYPYLSFFLLEQARYRDWAEIQLLQRISPAEIAAGELEAMERAAPELLLPLFHQAIERHIEERTKEHYREAAGLLQRLKLLYEACGAAGTWELFMERFTARYARLRALHKELREGALLT
ncbi:SWIM zinc finger family protein [Paenibacillus thiaminolyticus]|uniref:SWIM zinc finger family protein n=1 Tax=Paenibacillus thiaminolyticus TaxID=49283 RepID=UPI002542953D|nr:SWIM zinc finger family protein [Paenibacillus thiaminolyticus]WII38074.1 SWIM zinc finger family protein [Paenibacillus thiaminolyticus]